MPGAGERKSEVETDNKTISGDILKNSNRSKTGLNYNNPSLLDAQDD